MGGGALKVEASHILRIPVPVFGLSEWKTLSILGQTLVSKGIENVLGDIDMIVCSVLLGRQATQEDCKDLSRISFDAKSRREHKKRTLINNVD
jgi:hypothetical protein